MRVLLTGGAGYIGSHTLLELLKNNFHVAVYDNYSNSSRTVLNRIRSLSNHPFLVFVGDIRDEQKLSESFEKFKPDCVIHFAGLKAVGESTKYPLNYYDQNFYGTLQLLKVMETKRCSKLIFSSSATVYGNSSQLPYKEDHFLAPTSPYGRTKMYIEKMIMDWCNANSYAGAVILRYFNPVGADVSGMIGENPKGLPNNLMPFISQVAVKKLKYLTIFGNDYQTRDGTGERDYIHVSDLADAHVAAMQFIRAAKGYEVVNIGTGKGVTVLELLHAFEKVSNLNIPYIFSNRRLGDVDRSIASGDKARMLFDWEPKFGISEMCESTWKWQVQNPSGYD